MMSELPMRISACMILPSGPGDLRQDLGAERLLVPVERAGRIVHDEVRRHRVMSGGNAAFSLLP